MWFHHLSPPPATRAACLSSRLSFRLGPGLRKCVTEVKPVSFDCPHAQNLCCQPLRFQEPFCYHSITLPEPVGLCGCVCVCVKPFTDMRTGKWAHAEQCVHHYIPKQHPSWGPAILGSSYKRGGAIILFHIIESQPPPFYPVQSTCDWMNYCSQASLWTKKWRPLRQPSCSREELRLKEVVQACVLVCAGCWNRKLQTGSLEMTEMYL